MQRAWADWTAAGVALRGYNTNESADDVDDLRKHLGVERIHLWGISYGSHLGLAILKRPAPRAMRTAISLCLAAPRDISRLATLAQAIKRTKTTAPKSMPSPARAPPVTVSCSGTSETP